jgi:hypothetical protein
MKAVLEETTVEVEKLKTMNVSLTQSLQEKEQTIAKYVTLSQSLRGLLNEPTEESVRLEIPAVKREFSEYQTPITKSALTRELKSKTPLINSEKVKVKSPPIDRPPASQGSLFIRAAKEELTYSDFNQMISEINRYNKHQQTREETITNVKQLLCPTHRSLFEQFLPMIGGK